ncbi:hypothetical protein BMS3Bbin04_01915 [bacterium BMS3Bbin04]|nr:hypothetical protein BMS3Bbin04_01915 [bacterium BMS3Bbin04]
MQCRLTAHIHILRTLSGEEETNFRCFGRHLKGQLNVRSKRNLFITFKFRDRLAKMILEIVQVGGNDGQQGRFVNGGISLQGQAICQITLARFCTSFQRLVHRLDTAKKALFVGGTPYEQIMWPPVSPCGSPVCQ